MFISANSAVGSISSSNSVLVPNLAPLTSYTFRIRAENDLGKSDFSPELTVATTIEGLLRTFRLDPEFPFVLNQHS